MIGDELIKYTDIDRTGSILLGKNTVVDGFRYGREIGIFSHIHKYDENDLEKAMHECHVIYVSPPTFDLLAILDQKRDDPVSADIYFSGRHIKRLNFDEPKTTKLHSRELNLDSTYADMITLKRAHHILGSAQILISTDDGKDIVYSSDFSHPETEPIDCDVLVLDSTHGDPMFNAPVDVGSLENRLTELVETEIESGNPICIRAHIGRLQYTMSILSERLPDDLEFISSIRNNNLADVYRKYNMPIRKLKRCDRLEGQDILEKNYPFIEFKTTHDVQSIAEMDERSTVFQMDGEHLGNKTTITQCKNKKKYQLELGKHENYHNILEYVKACNPGVVITGDSQSGWGSHLAKKIKNELGIDAISKLGE